MNLRYIRFFSLLTTLFLLVFVVSAQQETNKTDAKGFKQGLWHKKDTNGKLIYSGFFKENIPDGEFIYYDSLGKIKARTIFSDNGLKAHTCFFEKGFKVSEGLYLNEKKHGEWKYFNQDSVIISIENYIDGSPEGKWQTFYGNGALLEETTYANGVKNGPWLQYFYDGPIKTKANYINDKLEGLATFYHPNGAIFISGPYKNNLKDGIWMHLNKEGVAEKREIWNTGFLVAEEYYDKALEKMMKEEK